MSYSSAFKEINNIFVIRLGSCKFHLQNAYLWLMTKPALSLELNDILHLWADFNMPFCALPFFLFFLLLLSALKCFNSFVYSQPNLEKNDTNLETICCLEN